MLLRRCVCFAGMLKEKQKWPIHIAEYYTLTETHRGSLPCLSEFRLCTWTRAKKYCRPMRDRQSECGSFIFFEFLCFLFTSRLCLASKRIFKAEAINLICLNPLLMP